MNEITISNNNGKLTVSSLQIAKDFGKHHKHLLETIESIKAENSAVTKMFIESTYKAGTGKTYKCYEITRDGFSLLVMGFTGKQALEWKLKYIEAFNLMESHIKTNKSLQTADDKSKTAEAKLMNARVRMANMYLKLAKVDTLSPDYKNILVAKSAEVLTGQALLPLPKSEKTYSAGDIAKMFGVSAQKIGRIAKANNMKTNEYGCWYKDKSPYSLKEVDVFRYNDKAVEKFKTIFK
ncbi:MAG: Rha family transcriptional regulator [Ruminococcus sp.]|nr:Rha family transcriptional regulator [Ruminococcus sp.]